MMEKKVVSVLKKIFTASYILHACLHIGIRAISFSWIVEITRYTTRRKTNLFTLYYIHLCFWTFKLKGCVVYGTGNSSETFDKISIETLWNLYQNFMQFHVKFPGALCYFKISRLNFLYVSLKIKKSDVNKSYALRIYGPPMQFLAMLQVINISQFIRIYGSSISLNVDILKLQWWLE